MASYNQAYRQAASYLNEHRFYGIGTIAEHGSIFKKQLQIMHIVLGERLKSRDEKLRFLSHLVGRTLTTSKELTIGEMQALINMQDRLPALIHEWKEHDPKEEPL